MLISMADAAKRLGITRQAIDNLKKNKKPPRFFKLDKKSGKYKIDDEMPEWQEFEKYYQKNKKFLITKTDLERRTKAKIKDIKDSIDMLEGEELDRKFVESKMKKEIYIAAINREKANQEKMRTLEMKRELAPIDLMKYFFSFAEDMIQRLYRRPHEISPQLAALYIAHEDKKAEQLLVREIEGIIVETKEMLLQNMEEEGFRYRKKLEKNKSANEGVTEDG